MYSKITGIGSYVPEKILDNSYFESILDTNDDWIISRTGIKKRHVCSNNETNLDLSLNAIKDLQENYTKEFNDIDFIICVTSTPDFIFPNLSSQIQNSLKIKNCGAIDLHAACAGFTSALIQADSLIKANTFKKILVVASETLSKVVDYNDRNTCILFGDAASCVIMEKSLSTDDSIVSVNSGSDGSQGYNLYQNNLGDTLNGEKINANQKINQNGRSVYKWLTQNIPNAINDFL
ncbi:MAG: hypothetical protein ACWIPI_10970, partial [Polaribacter sp.]